ncbi:MAG: S16 family serine protease [Methanoculleus sp.]
MPIREKTLTVLLVLSLVANTFLLAAILTPADGSSPALSKPGEAEVLPTATLAPLLSMEATGNRSVASMQVPVILRRIEIDQNCPLCRDEVIEEATMVNVSVEVVPGRGRVLVQTTPLTGIVFQDAANHAVAAVANRSRMDLTENDIIFSIQDPGEISEIDGPSAGALMAALLLAVLEDFSLNESVTVTGTLDEDGRVGPVGGVFEKAGAAAASGKALLLLSTENNWMTDYQEDVRWFGGLRLARQRPVVKDTKEYIEENLDIQVKYVTTLDDLLADIRMASGEQESRSPTKLKSIYPPESHVSG